MNFAEIWNYVGPILGAFLGFIGSYILERRKEFQRKREYLQTIECVELVNTQISFDEKLLGAMASYVQIKVPKGGPTSELIDVRDIYFARYRIRNLSDTPIEKILIGVTDSPSSVWFNLSEGEGQNSPEWSKQRLALMKEERAAEDKGWARYPIPYLNPYSETKHEVYFDLSSYFPLDKIKVAGGAKGIRFVYKKAGEDGDNSRQIFVRELVLNISIGIIVAILAGVLVNIISK